MVSKRIKQISGKREDLIRSKIPYTKALNGKYVKVVENSFNTMQSYLDLMDTILVDTPGSDIPVGDEQFRNMLYEMTDHYVEVVESYFNPNVLKSPVINFPASLMERWKVSKSEFLLTKLLDDMAGYNETRKSRTMAVPLTVKAKSVYLQHCKRLNQRIVAMMELPPEIQNDALVAQLPANKNAGWPFFFKQSKKNVHKLTLEILNKLSVRLGSGHKFAMEYVYDEIGITKRDLSDPKKWTKDAFVEGKFTYITVRVIVGLARFITEQTKGSPFGYTPPYISFYRTQGGKETKVRSVFGGWFGLKLVGMLVSAAKHDSEFIIPTIGDLPWIAAMNYDQLFDQIAASMDETLDNPPYAEWAGEDMSRYDNSIMPMDLSWIFVDTDISKEAPIYQLLAKVGYFSMLGSDTWVGKRRIPGLNTSDVENRDADYIFFNSGNPFTSEFGSLVHMMISYYVADLYDWQLVHSCYLSDDNISCWNKYDVDLFVKALTDLGFVINKDKTFVYTRDGVVSFLKYWLGPLLSADSTKILWGGDANSRWYNMLHSERDVEEENFEAGFATWVVLNEAIPLNRTINQILSKLGSYGRISLPVLTEILGHREFKNNFIGGQILSAISLMKAATLELNPARLDLPATTSPAILTEIDFTSLRIKGEDGV